VTAGMTHFFKLFMVDIYGNSQIATVSSATTNVLIMAEFVDFIDYYSPIGVPDISNWQ
jgi:hypothetical protein